MARLIRFGYVLIFHLEQKVGGGLDIEFDGFGLPRSHAVRSYRDRLNPTNLRGSLFRAQLADVPTRLNVRY